MYYSRGKQAGYQPGAEQLATGCPFLGIFDSIERVNNQGDFKLHEGCESQYGSYDYNLLIRVNPNLQL